MKDNSPAPNLNIISYSLNKCLVVIEMDEKLRNLGFTEEIIEQAAKFKGYSLGRVIAQYKNLYKVYTVSSVVLAEVSGKLRYSSEELSDYPAVGDFVMIDRADQNSNAIIKEILPRKSVFIRKAAGTSHDVQVIATNIDTVFICMSLNKDFNLRRLERYLSIAWDSGAIPVIVLTKADLSGDPSTKLHEVEEIALGCDVLITSSLTSDSYKPVLKYVLAGRTVAFIGSSGVGKSTLINRLLGKEIIETKDIRNDDKGRHATTRRELFTIPSGGAVIDTPGMRELGVESADLATTFSDIDKLARRCRFNDCSHESEPGCAVKEAIEKNELSAKRFQNYLKLQKEADFEGLNSREIEQQKTKLMYADFDGAKNAKKYIKSKSKNYNRHDN